MLPRTYLTHLTTKDGEAHAQVLSVPDFLQSDREEAAADLASQLVGANIQTPITAGQLSRVLRHIALETVSGEQIAGRRSQVAPTLTT